MKKILIVLLLCFPNQVVAQGISLEYYSGYGTYQLSDIKEMQNEILKNNKYGLKITDTFSGHITHSFSLGYKSGNKHFGCNFLYLTTGSRLNRADYSGSYTIDILMNALRLGLFYRELNKTKIEPLFLCLQISSGAVLSKLDIKERLNIFSKTSHKNSTRKCTGVFLEPNAGLIYQINDWLNISMSVGYEIDFLAKFDYRGPKVHWNGVRFYGGLIIFPTKINSKK